MDRTCISFTDEQSRTNNYTFTALISNDKGRRQQMNNHSSFGKGNTVLSIWVDLDPSDILANC